MNGTTELHGNMAPVKISPEDTETPLNEAKVTTRGDQTRCPQLLLKIIQSLITISSKNLIVKMIFYG